MKKKVITFLLILLLAATCYADMGELKNFLEGKKWETQQIITPSPRELIIFGILDGTLTIITMQRLTEMYDSREWSISSIEQINIIR